METLLVIARFGQFSAAMLLLGSSLFRLGFVAGNVGAMRLDHAFGRWHRPIMITGAAVALASSLVWLDIESGLMGGAWSDAVDLQTLGAVLFQTRFGHVWLWTLASAAALLLVAFLSSGGRSTIVVAGLSAILLASSAATGHAVMHTGIAGATHLTAQIIHVLAASVWLGSLPALGFALRKGRLEGQPEWRNAVRSILPRYSRMGYVAVAFILLTGCVNSWFMVDSVDALFETTYGKILLAKISLVFVMVGVAIVNRFVLAPDVTRSPLKPFQPEASFRRLWRSVTVEQALGLSIIGLVSLLGTVAPAMSGNMEM